MVQGEEPFPDFYYLSLSPSIAEPPFDAPDEQQRVWGRMWGSFDEVGALRVALVRNPGTDRKSVV